MCELQAAGRRWVVHKSLDRAPLDLISKVVLTSLSNRISSYVLCSPWHYLHTTQITNRPCMMNYFIYPIIPNTRGRLLKSSSFLLCASHSNYKLSFPPPLYLYLLLSLVVASNLNKVIFWTASIVWLMLWMRMLGVKCLCLVWVCSGWNLRKPSVSATV